LRKKERPPSSHPTLNQKNKEIDEHRLSTMHDSTFDNCTYEVYTPYESTENG
jgi:hypothetical protein